MTCGQYLSSGLTLLYTLWIRRMKNGRRCSRALDTVSHVEKAQLGRRVGMKFELILE
jgi:hypothetical protein